QVRPSLAVRSRKSLDVKRPDALQDVAAAAVDDPVAARHQAVEVAMHRLAGPVTLGTREVGRGASVELGHRQHLGGRERVEVSRAGVAGRALLVCLVGVLGGFVVVFGYFWTCVAFWAGQTIGKKVFRLRAVGDRGEPMTFFQAGIRNVVRIVDFLPYGYGVGL